jgi:GNAT superfamily N-acetyltransferase
MEISEATVEDAETVAREFWYPLAKHVEQYSALNAVREDAADHAVDEFEDRIGGDDHRIFLLEVDGDANPVACITVELGERPSREHGDHRYIGALHVKESHRGNGYGTALVEHAEALADREDCDFLKGSAEWRNEPARNLYESMGYDPKQVTYTKPLD